MSDCQLFCEAEVNVTDSGTTYNWPKTLAGELAAISCPFSDKFSVNRSCDVNGEWLSFNQTDCGVVFEQLIGLNNAFNNVCETIDDSNIIIVRTGGGGEGKCILWSI